MKLRAPRSSEYRRSKADEVPGFESTLERRKVEMRKILEPYPKQLIKEADLDSLNKAKQEEAVDAHAYLALLFPEKPLASSKLKQCLEDELKALGRPDYALEFIYDQFFPRKQFRAAGYVEEEIEIAEYGEYPPAAIFLLSLMAHLPEQRTRWKKMIESNLQRLYHDLTRPPQPGQNQRIWKENMEFIDGAFLVLIRPEFKLSLQQCYEEKIRRSEYIGESMRGRILRHDSVSEIAKCAFFLEVFFGDSIQGVGEDGQLAYKKTPPKSTQPLPERALT